ncbi:MAG: hypothetical protein AAF724_00050 [Pseudomonadota bacterium]
MNEKRNENGRHFLPIGEAARLLGLSRMRLREAIAKGLISAKRDNEGRLRVDLTAVPSDLERKLSGKAIAPSGLLDALFDEVEELQGLLEERDTEIGQIRELLNRQDSALERSLAILQDRKTPEPDKERRAEALSKVSDRALAMLDEATGKLEASLAANARYQQLLERALALSEASSGPGENNAKQLTAAADRAMSLLDRALKEAEAKNSATAELSSMLDRSLAAGNQLEQQIRESEALVRRHEAAVGRMMKISDRAINLVTVQPRKRWWLVDWLTGRQA